MLAAIAAAGLAYSYFVEPRRLVVNRQTLTIDGWPQGLDGLKIVAIADIHGGSNAVDEAKLRRIVETVNAESADLIVLLGDYVSQRGGGRSELGDRELKMPLATLMQNLSGLSARHGVMVVMGNHDDWYGSGEIAAGFRGLGYTVLDDQIVSVVHDGTAFRIFGLRDQLHVGNWEEYTGRLKRVIAESGGSGPIVALEHSPDVFPIVTDPKIVVSRDLRLMLAAHTHGGQVWLPLLGTPIVPSSYGQKYSYGHVRENGADLFVTSGIGTSILPFRFMMPPEIAVLTVQSSGFRVPGQK